MSLLRSLINLIGHACYRHPAPTEPRDYCFPNVGRNATMSPASSDFQPPASARSREFRKILSFWAVFGS